MTTATAAAMAIARERQLDWLLGEVLGGETARARRSMRRRAMPWLAAAIAVLAAGTATAVAVLQRGVASDATGGGGGAPVQEPAQPAWHECHGPAALADVPADVTALRCFDFDDAACARLATFTKLEHLDLSGMDVNDKGYSVSLKVTDAGVRTLAPLTGLRWLSLASCHDMKGEGLAVLEAMPRLEHLDLTYSGVESPAIERLPRLPALRSLVLSHCMNFHGRSLAAVANIPGLRRLELRACTTLSAKDVLHVAKLKELRHLDLRDCQGRFRGQRASGLGGNAVFVDTDNDGLPDKRVEPPPPPLEDGIGITDDVVVALSALPLETLLLGGSESLTDAIGEPIAQLRTLRSLDLSNLPKTTGSLLARLPPGLESLALDDNPHWPAASFRSLPALPHLRELGLPATTRLSDEDLKAVLAGLDLHTLRLDAAVGRGKDLGSLLGPHRLISNDTVDAILSQKNLTSLSLRSARRAPGALGRIASLPRLQSLDLANASVGDELRELAASRSIQNLNLTWSGQLDPTSFAALAELPLRELNLFRTNLDRDHGVELGKRWPGCLIVMPNGERFRAP